MMAVSQEVYKGSNEISIGDYCFETAPKFPYVGSVINQ
jgi:hypothetical protein